MLEKLVNYGQVAQKVERLAYYYWIVLLFGYIFLNKGFACLGFSPLYVSEIGLILAFSTVLVVAWQKRAYWARLKQGLVIILGVFLFWQLVRTIPYLCIYQLNAIRDAMLWGYAAFTFFILIAFTNELLIGFVRIYSFLVPFFLLWYPLEYLLERILGLNIPVPGASVSLWVKAGDVRVYLAGMGAFLLIRLDERFGHPYPSWLRWV
jgi:hypothetical protein